MTALAVICRRTTTSAWSRPSGRSPTVVDLLAKAKAYRLDAARGRGRRRDGDVYFACPAEPGFGEVSVWTREQMLEVFAERGGDPDRAGKRDPLDPLLWRAHRPASRPGPAASSVAGRPGWHIECTSIALDHLGMSFDVQGGGTDLVFPHHEMSAVQATGAHRRQRRSPGPTSTRRWSGWTARR